MARQKRYRNEKEILDLIDQNTNRAVAQLKRAEELDREADQHRRTAQELEGKLRWEERASHVVEMGNNREEARRLRKRATTTIEKHLPKLGRLLAAFRTQTLISGDDRSVVME